MSRLINGNATCAQISEFLRRLKAPAPEVMRAVFTRGGCGSLPEILKDRFPGAVGYQTCSKDGRLTGEHVITRIGCTYWDITGRRKAKNPRGKIVRVGRLLYRPMSICEQEKAAKWKCGWSTLIAVTG